MLFHMIFLNESTCSAQDLQLQTYFAMSQVEPGEVRMWLYRQIMSTHTARLLDIEECIKLITYFADLDHGALRTLHSYFAEYPGYAEPFASFCYIFVHRYSLPQKHRWKCINKNACVVSVARHVWSHIYSWIPY